MPTTSSKELPQQQGGSPSASSTIQIAEQLHTSTTSEVPSPNAGEQRSGLLHTLMETSNRTAAYRWGRNRRAVLSNELRFSRRDRAFQRIVDWASRLTHLQVQFMLRDSTNPDDNATTTSASESNSQFGDITRRSTGSLQVGHVIARNDSSRDVPSSNPAARAPENPRRRGSGINDTTFAPIASTRQSSSLSSKSLRFSESPAHSSTFASAPSVRSSSSPSSSNNQSSSGSSGNLSIGSRSIHRPFTGAQFTQPARPRSLPANIINQEFNNSVRSVETASGFVPAMPNTVQEDDREHATQ